VKALTCGKTTTNRLSCRTSGTSTS
jgi:hypothetical protein